MLTKRYLCLATLTIPLCLAILIVIFGVSGDKPKSNVCSSWIVNWRNVALECNLPEEAIDEIATIIRHYLECVDSSYSEHLLTLELQEKYKNSLRNFIKTQFPQFQHSLPRYRASGHWLAYCVGQAHQRFIKGDALSGHDKPYETFLEALTKVIRLEYKRLMSVPDYNKWSGEIEEHLEQFTSSSLEYIHRLQSDILFPSFRGEPTETEAFLYMIDLLVYSSPPFSVPRYEEPLEMLVSKDNRFKSSLKSYFNQLAVNDALSSLFMKSLYPQLSNEAPYWSDVEWRAKSLDVTKSDASVLYWPARVTLTFDLGDITVDKYTIKN